MFSKFAERRSAQASKAKPSKNSELSATTFDKTATSYAQRFLSLGWLRWAHFKGIVMKTNWVVYPAKNQLSTHLKSSYYNKTDIFIKVTSRHRCWKSYFLKNKTAVLIWNNLSGLLLWPSWCFKLISFLLVVTNCHRGHHHKCVSFLYQKHDS